MPDPRPGEPRDDFISRCIPVVLDDGTAEDNDQAVAICNSMWEDADKRSGEMEHKTFSGFVTKADEEQGIIETVFAVFGNIDSGNDIIHPGAFTKTFAEQGHKVKVLDNHRTDTIMRAIGKPLMLKEMPHEEMPAEMLESHPGVTGGAFARVQMLMDTPEGKGAFIRLRDKAVTEWSFGYDALDVDFSQAVEGGKEINVRNLRTIKLYEISPVLFGMNEATTTLSAKADEKERPAALFGYPIVWTDKMPPIKAGDIVLSNWGDEATMILSGKADMEKNIDADVEAFLLEEGILDIVSPSEKASARAVENKAINLSQQVGDVIQTFYAKFPDVHNPNHGTILVYWVKQVWDEFLIVEQEGTHGRRLWKIAYSIDEEGAIDFAPQQNWLEVTMAFVPLSNEPSKTAPPQEAAMNEHDQAQAGPQDAPTSKELLDELELLALETQTLEVT